ncbi:MAG TPA: hypothetical protein VLM80_07295 [Anaerolineales bacterium]|nr:hypothetical protein [Anaerolineales bacterium]
MRKIFFGILLVIIILVSTSSACTRPLVNTGEWVADQLTNLSSSPVATALSTLSVLKAQPSQTPAKADAHTPVPLVETPTPTDVAIITAPTTNAKIQAAAPNLYHETLFVFQNSYPPLFDPFDLSSRLNGQYNLPRQLDGLPVQFQVGDQKTFWVTNNDSNDNFQVQATLQYETEHVYFWIDDRVSSYSQKDLKNLVETFERDIYPTTRAFFGSEWTPGVDNDPHLFILYASGVGRTVAGYFSSTDSYLPIVREYSNAHEMFMLSADVVDLEDEYAYGVLAHEFQHMIHWYTDRNEETWLNEGLSNLAMLINGYSTGGSERAYLNSTDLQLNYWSYQNTNRTANYGVAFLFSAYILDRFGEQITQALVKHEENGLTSLDQVLAEKDVYDALSGEAISADDIFRDWALANWLQDERLVDGRYANSMLTDLPQPAVAKTVRTCPAQLSSQDVSQYGVDYIRIRCTGDYTLSFDGLTQVSVLPTQFHSGSYAFYSNTGDESAMSLTRFFDFSQHQGDLTLKYWTWYDIEDDYDYLYLMASVDGENWQILSTPSGTTEDPNGNSYGWAYNGQSSHVAGQEKPQWIQESIDLSAFAGQQIYLRFEYITDAAVYHEGFVLDDVQIPEIGYFTDFEQDDGGWQAEGFVRIQNSLPQKFIVSIITIGDETTVEHLTLDANNDAVIPLKIGKQVDEVILVVSGASRYTRQKAGYQVSIQP